MEEILNKAEIIFNYLNTKDEISKSNVILGCGSMDTSIVDKAKELDDSYHPKTIIFSGYKGKGTLGKIKISEAKRFEEYALNLNIDKSKIKLEETAKTTYQNLKKSLIHYSGDKITIIHKPYVLRRTKLMCEKLNIDCNLTCIDLSFNDYIDKITSENNGTLDQIINEIVGEIYMLKHYKLFNLSKSKIDDDILNAYKFLKKKGYRKYII